MHDRQLGMFQRKGRKSERRKITSIIPLQNGISIRSSSRSRCWRRCWTRHVERCVPLPSCRTGTKGSRNQTNRRSVICTSITSAITRINHVKEDKNSLWIIAPADWYPASSRITRISPTRTHSNSSRGVQPR
jgi:hypothetical protein